MKGSAINSLETSLKFVSQILKLKLFFSKDSFLML